MGDEGSAVPANYAPVAKMQEKSAQLRADLDMLLKPGSLTKLKKQMSVRISEAPSARVSSAGFMPVPTLQSPPPPPPASSLARGRSARSSTLNHTDSMVSSAPTDNLDIRTLVSTRRSSRTASAYPGRSSTAQAQAAAAHASDRYQAQLARVSGLEDDLETQRAKVAELTREMDRQQESFMRREDQQAAQMSAVQQQLAIATGASGAAAAAAAAGGNNGLAAKSAAFGRAGQAIKVLHGQMIGEIEGLLEHQAAALRHEEHSTLRHFRAKLADVEAQVMAEKAGQDKHQREWMEKTTALRHELEKTQEIANKLDRMFKMSDEECGRLRAQFKCQEDDREYLIRQVVGLKKERERLLQEMAALGAELQHTTSERDELLQELDGEEDPALRSPPSGAARPGGPAAAGDVDAAAVRVKVQRYEDVIESLKRLLEAERRRTKYARAAHMVELQQRTELQALMRQAIEDIRARRVSAQAPLSAGMLRAADGDGERDDGLTEGWTPRGVAPSGIPPPFPGGTFGGGGSGGGDNGRPRSAFPPRAAVPARPFSAVGGPGGAGGAANRRPFSASPASTRKWPVQGGPGAAAPETDEALEMLDAGERAVLVQELVANEAVIKLLFETAFPGVVPLPPGDPSGYLNRIATFQEGRDTQVVANARSLAGLGGGGGKRGPSMAAAALASSSAPPPQSGALPGGSGSIIKEAASKRWVLNVDALMSQFLSTPARAVHEGAARR